VRGSVARGIRKGLGIVKPTEASESGYFRDEKGQLMFRRRTNPKMNSYRWFKRAWTEGKLNARKAD
jgi:hypothetical protein